MEAFIDGLKRWLKRHNTEERPGDSYKPPLDPFRPSRDRNKDEKHWFIKDDAGKDQVDSQRNKGTPWGNFISSEAVNQLKLNPTHNETRQMVTLNGTKRQSMPIFHIAMDSLDGKTRERIEVTGSKMPEFATVRRPDMNELKFKYEHARDKKFYVKPGDEHKIDIILGDNTYCKIKTEKIFKGNPGEPIVEGTTFGWVIHGGDDHVTDQCMFMRETSDYEKLYSLDVLGVQDRGENDQLDVLKEFKDDIRRREDGRYEVRVPWIPGSTLESTNEQTSRSRIQNANKKLIQNPELKEEYDKIIKEQLRDGILETVPEQASGERTFYMPHKPVVRDSRDLKQQTFVSHERHLIPRGNWVEDGVRGAKIKVKLLR